MEFFTQNTCECTSVLLIPLSVTCIIVTMDTLCTSCCCCVFLAVA